MLQALFTSKVRIALLTRLFIAPGETFYARRLAKEMDEPYNAVWRELTNLERIGLLTAEQSGNVKHYRLNPDFPIYDELKRIVFKTSGLGQALRDELAQLGAVEWAFIYGSVAAGEEDAHSDLDLMMVGDVDLLAFAELIARVEERLSREINYLVLTREELVQRLKDRDPFTQNVLSGLKIMLIGDESGLREIARTGTG